MKSIQGFVLTWLGLQVCYSHGSLGSWCYIVYCYDSCNMCGIVEPLCIAHGCRFAVVLNVAECMTGSKPWCSEFASSIL
ncbi:unnamed protein product [Lathyrus oleraceus]